MSSDTARENASVVDSSVTEWKNDMEISDDLENEDGYPFRTQGLEHSHVADKRSNLCNTRYFIIKSLNHQNIQLSIEKGIWATQVMNEPILEEAFRNSGSVILIFSVNMSGFFQGVLGSNGLSLNHLPFQKTLHLKNPLNDYKPVKISRDCQELSQDVGEALCELLDVSNDVDVSLKRDDLASKRPCLESPYSLGDEDYNVPPVHMSWAGTPMPCNPYLYQHQVDPSRYHLTHPHTLATEYFPTTIRASKVASMKSSRINRNLTNLQVNHDMSTQFDAWGLSAESPLASTLTEDDFLEMTYEEYLEAHGRTSKLSHPVTAPSQTVQESTSGKHGDDSNSSVVTDRRHSRKRRNNSS
ncbi:hypothetical protein V6N13_109514 [Hibiscus sabdariffa]|uniref:YTH domain-containing family protein n=1 Tax=Hibiscus sabdariffa TaxID=183260 RepID=A0ABR2FPS7_9ROSI